MHRDWLHLPSVDRTIDLNVVSEILWNREDKYNKRVITVVYLGTSLVSVEGKIVCNELPIYDQEDRETLYAKFPAIPIDLLVYDDLVNEDEDDLVNEDEDD